MNNSKTQTAKSVNKTLTQQAKTAEVVDVTKEVNLPPPIAPLTHESLVSALPEGLNPDADKIASVIVLINEELVKAGATFGDGGYIVGIDKPKFSQICNMLILREFNAEIRSVAKAEAAKIVQQNHADDVKGLSSDDIETIIDELVDVMMDGATEDIDDKQLEELVQRRIGMLQAKHVRTAHDEADAKVEIKITQPKVDVEVTVSTEPVGATSEEFEAGLINSGQQRLEIKATDADGKEVKVAKVALKRISLPYVPTFEQKQDAADEWIAVASPIPMVTKLNAEEIKEIVAKTIVAFRDDFNGKQCHWNTKLVFPDECVDVLNMFTEAELTYLVWGYAEPDLDCWDVQRVVPHVYGLEYFYKDEMAA